MELVGVDQREPGQYSCIDSVAFGVALIVTAQIGDLLVVDQLDRHRLARVRDGDGKPGHADRFHHDLHQGPGCTGAWPSEQLIQVIGSGVDGQDRGAELPALVQNHRFWAAWTAKSRPMVHIYPPFT
jgi:hypothetical protein